MNSSDNTIVENAVQSVRVVHEEDARMNLSEQVAHIVKTFLDDDTDIGNGEDGQDSISDYSIHNNDDDDVMNSSDYSDEEAVIDRMESATKNNTKIFEC